MPRPKAEDPRLAFTIRLPASVLDTAKQWSEKENLTLRQWCEQVIVDALAARSTTGP